MKTYLLFLAVMATSVSALAQTCGEISLPWSFSIGRLDLPVCNHSKSNGPCLLGHAGGSVSIFSGPAQVISTQWGATVHRPNALARAVKEQDKNDLDLGIGSSFASWADEIDNRQRAARATLRLPEVVSVMITKTADDSHFFVISLMDVDGNKSSIWTASGDDSKALPVTGVEPY